MAKRIRVKHQKARRDKASAYKKGEWPLHHKINTTRSRLALKKKAFKQD